VRNPVADGTADVRVRHEDVLEHDVRRQLRVVAHLQVGLPDRHARRVHVRHQHREPVARANQHENPIGDDGIRDPTLATGDAPSAVGALGNGPHRRDGEIGTRFGFARRERTDELAADQCRQISFAQIRGSRLQRLPDENRLTVVECGGESARVVAEFFEDRQRRERRIRETAAADVLRKWNLV